MDASSDDQGGEVKPLRAEVREHFSALFEVLAHEGDIAPGRLAQWQDALEKCWQVLTPAEQVRFKEYFDFLRR